MSGLALAGCAAMAWGQNPATTTALAPAWSDLFKRTQGWTGADGIFAIPLSGYEGPDHAAGNKTLFVFSDTFIGRVDAAGKRVNSTMVNNSMAILEGAIPDTGKIRFLWGRNSQGGAASAFIPNTPATAGMGAWYWLQDGFAHKGRVYNLPLIVRHNPSGPAGFQFEEVGIGLVRIPLGANGEPDMAAATQKDTPLYYKAGGRTFYYGCGIMVNTAEAGAPSPDGYVYVYGRNSLYVARVPPDEFEDFSKWRYWDGSDWNADISKSASLGAGGPELSVSPITTGTHKGKYLMVSCGVEPNIWIRIGDSPRGPFGNKLNVFRASEWETTTPIYVYNAKAHPSLSSNGDWLVTYNVNTSNWDANLAKADIYRPRFFYLRLDSGPIIGVSTRSLIRGRREASARGLQFTGQGMPVIRLSGGQEGLGAGMPTRVLRLDGRREVLTIVP